MDGLYWETWYNNKAIDKDDLGYIYYENKLLGVPRIRQLKVNYFLPIFVKLCSLTSSIESFFYLSLKLNILNLVLLSSKINCSIFSR